MYLWNGTNLAAEVSANTNALKARYLRGAGLICQLIDSSTFYYLFNGHGDVVQRADQNGNLQVPYEYDAFGNNTRKYNVGYQPNDGLETDPNPFRYCGEYFDSDIGEVYLRNRSYNSGSGRFTSEDPIRSGNNWYGYCGGNPVRFNDPSGLRYDEGPVRNSYEVSLGLPITSSAYNGRANAVFNPLYIPPTPNPSKPPATPVYPSEPPAATPPLAGNSTDITEYFTFDSNPTFNAIDWNTPEYQQNTNCYAYAFNMLVNPLTGQKFPIGGMQPGMLSGQYNIRTQKDLDTYFKKYLAGNMFSNTALVELVKSDANATGLDFLPYDENLQGGYRVALVVNPNTDYHWYRDNGDGTWSHKPGQTTATNLEVLGVGASGLVYGDIVTDPISAGATAGYTSFVGYFYIRPL